MEEEERRLDDRRDREGGERGGGRNSNTNSMRIRIIWMDYYCRHHQREVSEASE